MAVTPLQAIYDDLKLIKPLFLHDLYKIKSALQGSIMKGTTNCDAFHTRTEKSDGCLFILSITEYYICLHYYIFTIGNHLYL